MLFTKNFFRAAALLLAVVMAAVMFGACANKGTPVQPTAEPTEVPTEAPTEEPTEAPTEEPTEAPVSGENDNALIVGVWKTSFNLAEEIRKSFEEDETGMFPDMEISDAFFDITLDFNEDGTFAMDIDPESYRAAMKQISDEMVPVLKDFMIAMLSAFSEEGEEYTEEEILEMLEISSWDELGEQMIGSVEDADLSTAGKYEYKDGLLYMSCEEDDQTPPITVTLDGDELTFVSVEDSENGIFSSEGFPMVFKKIA